MVGDSRGGPAGFGPASAGVVLLLVALVFGRARLVAPSVVLLGAGYLLRLIGHGPDGGAALQGTVLFGVAELAFWSLERHPVGGPTPGGDRRRVLVMAATVAVAAPLGAAVVVLGATLPTVPAAPAAAALAAVAVVGVMAGLARQVFPS